MHVVHGTWIPDDAHEFMQSGAFYLWVESDAPLDPSWHAASAIHPRHLRHKLLTTFLLEKLGLRETVSDALTHAVDMKYFLLPTVGDKPAPSFELLRYVDEEEPIEFDLIPWQICCYSISDIISTLNDIHFIALNAAEDFQLGADFLFWHQYTQVMKGIIAKEQYIPALKYRASIPTKGKRTKKAASKEPEFELHPGWELLSNIYETSIQRYITAMPEVCTAGLNSPDSITLFDKESLLRHFSESLLHNVVTGTPFTAKFDQQIADTLLYKSVYPYRPALPDPPADALEEYKHWLTWRTNLTRAHRGRLYPLLSARGSACHRSRQLAPALSRRGQARSLAQAGPG